jgi:hypothetical protein
MGIREDMPVLASHEGTWTGEYVHVDATGTIIDRHRADLSCSFPEDGSHPYYQVNTYTWDDGRQEVIRFPAEYRDQQIWFNTDRIDGRAWEIDERTVMLTWQYKSDPSNYLYEMIQIDASKQHRARTWHWFEGGVLVKRTLINEQRVS